MRSAKTPDRPARPLPTPLSDPVFLTSVVLYTLNRILGKPLFGHRIPFLKNHFDDLLLIPCALPPLLFLQGLLGLRKHAGPPNLDEIAMHLVVFSVLIEGVFPRVFPRGTADWLDVVAYCTGGAIAFLLWNKSRQKNPQRLTLAPMPWLVKQEPEDYPWSKFVADRETLWTGVRNYQARNNLNSMKAGDAVLYYHSGKERAVVGLARVLAPTIPDPTSTEKGWVAVALEPVKPLKHPVTLQQIRQEPSLSDIALLRNSRLSVMPIPEEAFSAILDMAGS